MFYPLRLLSRNLSLSSLCLLLFIRYEIALKGKEDTEESLKRRPISAGEPEMPSQVCLCSLHVLPFKKNV